MNWLDKLLGLNNVDNTSIVTNDDATISVGVISDAQHGERGATTGIEGHNLHPLASGPNPGFIDGASLARIQSATPSCAEDGSNGQSVVQRNSEGISEFGGLTIRAQNVTEVTTNDATTATPVFAFDVPTGYYASVEIDLFAKVTSGAHSGQFFHVRTVTDWKNTGSGAQQVTVTTPTSGVEVFADETGGAGSGGIDPSLFTATTSGSSVTSKVKGIAGTTIKWNVTPVVKFWKV